MNLFRLPRFVFAVAVAAFASSVVSAQTVINVLPASDTWARSGTPTQTYGTATEMLLGTINPTSGGSPGADVAGADVARLFLSFNLADSAVTSALEGLTVTGVTLSFKVNSTDGSSVSNVVSYSLFNTASFNAATLTWDTRPAPSGSAVSTLSTNPTLLAAGDTVTFGNSVSFTALVEASRGGTLNLLLKQTAEGTPASRELLRLRTADFTGTDNDPVLTITAIPEPSAFAVLAGLGALGLAAARRRRRDV